MNLINKESTPEGRRKVALYNLIENPILIEADISYLVKKDGGYGQRDINAVHEFKYLPALKSEKGSSLMLDSLLNSRVDGEMFTGNISEYQIIQDCAAIVQGSIQCLKVKDILNLMGSTETKIKYGEVYLSDLKNSGDDKDKQFYALLSGSYISYLMNAKVTEAFTEQNKKIRGDLEEIVMGRGER